MLLTMQQQEALVSQKLATKKVCGDYVTYKYAKRVMYDYLWDKYPELLECRGHTYNIHTGKLVLCPPKKSFNYLENGTWGGVSLDTPVIAFHKYNGFMASARIVDGELLVATTGTTNPETSQYVGWAKREIEKLPANKYPRDFNTTIYEIVIPEDPHIVDDGVTGAVPLLVRSSDGGYWYCGASWETTLGNVLKEAHTARHEGWMVYDAEQYRDGVAIPTACKIKTDYYVGKKKLMRMPPSKVDNLWSKKTDFWNSLPIGWQHLAYQITKHHTADAWKQMTDQERRVIIEGMEKEYYD